MGARTRIFLGSAAAGAVGGWVFAQQRLVRHRRDLFSPRRTSPGWRARWTRWPSGCGPARSAAT